MLVVVTTAGAVFPPLSLGLLGAASFSPLGLVRGVGQHCYWISCCCCISYCRAQFSLPLDWPTSWTRCMVRITAGTVLRILFLVGVGLLYIGNGSSQEATPEPCLASQGTCCACQSKEEVQSWTRAATRPPPACQSPREYDPEAQGWEVCGENQVRGTGTDHEARIWVPGRPYERSEGDIRSRHAGFMAESWWQRWQRTYRRANSSKTCKYDTSTVQTHSRRCEREGRAPYSFGTMDCITGTPFGGSGGARQGHFSKIRRRPQRGLPGDAVRSCGIRGISGKDRACAGTARTDLVSYAGARNFQDCWRSSSFQHSPACYRGLESGSHQHGRGFCYVFSGFVSWDGRQYEGSPDCATFARFDVFFDDFGGGPASSPADIWPCRRSCARNQGHEMEEASQRTPRAPGEESKTRSPSSMDIGGHRPHSRSGPEDCSHSDRRRRRTCASTCAAVGTAVLVYFVVTSPILCRQSRLRFDRGIGVECRAGSHATTASGCTDRGRHGRPGRRIVARARAHASIPAGTPNGWTLCQNKGVLANGQAVPECTAEAPPGTPARLAGYIGSCARSLQLCSLNSTRVAVSQCATRAWRAVCRIYSPSLVEPDSCPGSGHSAVPVLASRAQSERRSGLMRQCLCIGGSTYVSCLHASWRGIFWQWVSFICISAGLGLLGWCLFDAFRTRFSLLRSATLAGLQRSGVDTGNWTVHRSSAERLCQVFQGSPLLARRFTFRGPARLQRKGVFLLWLVLTPSAQGVQVWRQATLHGQPVFNTGSVPGTRNIQELRPTRLPNHPVTGSRAQVDDECYREICVFAPDLRSCHAALLVDVRLRGRALEVSICRALGRQAVEWDCYRVQESLPALPPEQYVLRKASTSWHLSVVPVDLRPVGGRLALAYADRVMPCGAIAHMAIADQAGLECPAELLCRTSQGWFEANAAILLLPHCDAFQVWPLQLVQAAPPPTTLSLLRQPSGSDRFESSLEPTSGPERALSEREISSAVVLSDNGLFYCQVDGFADKDSIRSSVLFAYLGPSGLGIEYGGITHFARVLPPLPDLPAVQFVAGCCEGPLQPTVVDLRALQGSLQVCCAEPDATPAQRIELAVAAGGEPDPSNPIIGRLSCGALQVLHREQLVHAFSPLLEAPPTPLILLPRRPNLGTGWDGASHTLEEIGAAFRPTAGNTVIGVFMLAFGHAGSIRWPGLLLLVGGLHCHLIGSVSSPVPRMAALRS